MTSRGRGLGAAATLAGRWSRLVEGETARRIHNGDGEAAAALGMARSGEAAGFQIERNARFRILGGVRAEAVSRK